MSRLEVAFCQSSPWRLLARNVVLPWCLIGERLGGTVLEIGSGSGAMAAELLRRFPAVSLTATDIDSRMLERAEQRLRPFGTRAVVRQVDATALPWQERQFDAVISIFMLHHVGAWEKGLREAARVLKPGGVLLVTDFLDGGLLRTSERLARSPGIRAMQWGALHRVLRDLPLTDTRVRKTGRLLVRLAANKEDR